MIFCKWTSYVYEVVVYRWYNYFYNDLMDLFKKAKTKEEQDFYIMLSNLALKREPKKVIGK